MVGISKTLIFFYLLLNLSFPWFVKANEFNIKYFNTNSYTHPLKHSYSIDRNGMLYDSDGDKITSKSDVPSKSNVEEKDDEKDEEKDDRSNLTAPTTAHKEHWREGGCACGARRK